jgi:hypothetical protein
MQWVRQSFMKIFPFNSYFFALPFSSQKNKMQSPKGLHTLVIFLISRERLLAPMERRWTFGNERHAKLLAQKQVFILRRFNRSRDMLKFNAQESREGTPTTLFGEMEMSVANFAPVVCKPQ